MKEYLEAGQIVNTFGVRGEVKISPWCDSAAFLKRFKVLYISGKAYRVLSSRVHKNMLITLFEGVEDVNAAMQLKNKIVLFAREDAHLKQGEFFLADIVGAKVIDENDNQIGILTEVIDLPAQNVYVVKGETEHTIPAVPEFILSTDIENGVIRVRLIEGM